VCGSLDCVESPIVELEQGREDWQRVNYAAKAAELRSADLRQCQRTHD
jgi:hypothetical protein